MKWRFSIEWNAWWLAAPGDDGLHDRLVYGPFSEYEARLAGEIHGVPFGGE